MSPGPVARCLGWRDRADGTPPRLAVWPGWRHPSQRVFRWRLWRMLRADTSHPEGMTLMLSDMLLLFAAVGSVVLFELAAVRWGVDSRRGLNPELPARRNI